MMGGCSPLNGSKSRYPRPSKALIRVGDRPVRPCPAVRLVRLAPRAAGTGNVAVLHSEADPEGMPLSRLLAVAGHIVAIRRQRFMGRHGLTPHGLTVLAYLEHGSGLTQREPARRCGISPSTLNHTVDDDPGAVLGDPMAPGPGGF
jgi:DNA-binding CsgD family transcriptional regulator